MARELTEPEKQIIEIRSKMANCGGLFEYRVRELQEAGLSPAKAIKFVAADYPEAHADYLKRAKNGQAGSLHGGTRYV